MNKKTDTYKRLGDYIRQVDVRNKELKVERLLGVNLSKEFIPSVANTIGADMSKYKVIQKNQFGCKLMSVGRDGIMPISLYKDDDPSLISSAYYVFEVNNEAELLPDYLFMWLIRPEFDRQLAFYAGADVRGGVTWDFLCDMPVLIPSIARQRELVAQYEALTRRIRINEQTIATLEETAQALYRKMFVEGIDKENLPKGWRMGTLGEVAESLYGYTEVASEKKNGPKYLRITDIVPTYIDWNSVPYCKINEIDYEKYKVQEGDIFVSRTGANIGWAKQIRFCHEDCVYASFLVRFRVTNNLMSSYVGYIMESQEYKDYIWTNQQGSAQPQANAVIMGGFSLIVPKEDVLVKFNTDTAPLYKTIDIKTRELTLLRSLQSLLLTKLSNA